MRYTKELKLVRVAVGVSLSGSSELDMKVAQRRHYNRDARVKLDRGPDFFQMRPEGAG